MTSDTVDTTATGSTRQARWLGDVGFYVDRQTRHLYLSRERSATVATLARLRAGLGREPGDDPTLWSVTLDGAPGEPRGDEPTCEERAVYTALTLYATHQQARDQAMHTAGAGLGQAVARLDRARPGAGEGVSPVRRRFDAAVTSVTLTELSQHLRGLVSQMRGESIGLDYGMLADDLFQFQLPGWAPTVRRRWGRQFYHLPVPAPKTNQTQHTLTEETP